MAIGAEPAASGFCVRVLGPLDVSCDGTGCDLGGPKQRLVLAILLVHAGEVVSTNALIDGLWGEHPPATARKSVQVHVSNLRRSLGEEFPLRTAPGGYVIQRGGLRLDVADFEADLDAARARLHTDPLAAERLLTGALARWYGSAYADLDDEQVLGPEIARLGELRLQALEIRAAAGIRMGRHADLIGELTTLCAEHRYREQLAELLMLALYRSGRQAEALRAYERTRSVLVEDLGVEPGRSLQELQRQILEHSTELALDEQSIDQRRAFLATEVESAPTMWDADPEAMQDAVARRDEILATAVTTNAGSVFRTSDDELHAVFERAADALHAAVDGQRALYDEAWPTVRPIRVRMGVDEGAATVRGSSFSGPALERARRMMASGHGGQILCSTRLAPQAPTPSRELGAFDFGGVGPLDVAQLDVVGLDVDFPELRPDRTPVTVVGEGTGQMIRGYELREQLGTGAHGVVFRAYHAPIGREVAIKVIRPELANQPTFVRRFEAEAQFVAQLEHPHIVSLYDFWRDPSGAYLVMGLLRGGSLDDALKRGPCRPRAAMRTLDQIGAALDHAHRHGVSHHNVKPANVLFDSEGYAYVSDFGIASRHIETGGVPTRSAVAYLSPEELAGADPGPQADMYGLALLTHEMLTGRRTPLGGQPAPVSEVRHDVPASLDAVIAKAAHPDPTERFERIDDFLRALRRTFGSDVVTGWPRVVTSDVRNPYKGLRAFTETDVDDFHGRDGLVDEVVEHVSSRRLTALVGPSGSGKSSIVMAGLIPRLRRRVGPGPGGLLITDMFPGSHPFEELEAALLRVGVLQRDGLLDELVSDERGLLRMSKQLLPDDESELVLVIDQFEELFVLTHDEEIRALFLESLVAVLSDARSRVRVVVTIRADHFDRPLGDPRFGSILRNSVVPVAMPTHEELAEAIARPAAMAGLEFDAGLVPRIVGDVASEPGALPLLQYALTELVDSRDGNRLTIAGYERTGRVGGALAQRAEEIFQCFGEHAREATREVLLRLVAVDEAGEDTRRRVRRGDLESLDLGEAVLTSVLDEFGSFRLLSFDRDAVTRGPTVEVAHEALIREWPRLRRWIDERRDGLLMERRLDAASAEWEANGRDPSYLFTGGQLAQYREWASVTDVRTTSLERAFLDAAQRDADAADKERRRRRSAVMAALSLLAVLACVAAVLAVLQRNEATRSAQRAAEDAAEANRLGDEAARSAERAAAQAEEADRLGNEAALEAEEADRLGDEAVALRREAEDALQAERRARALADAQVLIGNAEERLPEDRDEGLLLAVAASDLLDAFDLELAQVGSTLMAAALERQPLYTLQLAPLDRVEFGGAASRISSDPVGGRLAVVVPSGGGTVVDVVDLATGASTGRLDTIEDPVSVYWDAVDGRIIVGGSGSLESVDPVTGDRGVLVAGVDGDLSVLSTSDEHVVYLSHVPAFDGNGERWTSVVADRAGRTIAEFPDHFWVSLSPNRDLLARYPVQANFADTSPAIVQTFPGGSPVATGAKAAIFGWTSSGELLTLDRADQAVEVWRPGDTGAPDRSFDFPQSLGLYPSARLSPDGRWIAVEAGVGLLQVHDAETLEPVVDPPLAPGPDDIQTPLTWSGDSRRLVTVGDDAVAKVWDVAQPNHVPGAYAVDTAIEPSSVAWLPDDRLLVGSSDGAWEVWDVRSNVLEDGRAPSHGASSLGRVVASVGGDLVAATAGTAEGIEVAALRSGARNVVGAGRFDVPLGFGPDGRLLAVSNRLVVERIFDPSPFGLLDVETGATILAQEPTNAGGLSATAAFSPDGDVVVFGVAAGPAALTGELIAFDTATGRERARRSIDGGGATSVAFSGDGAVLAVGSFAGHIELHDAAAFVDGRESLIGAADTGRDEMLVNLIVSDDGSTISVRQVDFTDLVTQVAPRGRTLAYSVDPAPEMLWSVALEAGVFDTRDGLLWTFTGTSLDLDGGGGVANLVGVPLRRSELADHARSIVTRALTELECQRHFRSSCAAFDARLG